MLISIYVAFLGVGLYAIYLCWGTVREALGFIPALLSLFFLPITILVVPWYAMFVKGNWFLLVLVYCGGTAFGLLFWVTKFLLSEKE